MYDAKAIALPMEGQKIKAKPTLPVTLLHIDGGHPVVTGLLGGGQQALRVTKGEVGAHLNFYKEEQLAAQCNQVDFGMAHAKVFCLYGKALLD